MNCSLLLAFSLPLLGLASMQSQAPRIVSLAALRGQSRPLLVFAPRAADPQLEIQVRIMEEHAAAAAERDIVVIAIPFDSPSPSNASLTDAEAREVRRRFNVPPADFAVILLGKDGGEKLRSSHPLSMEKVSATIDAMPMRQEEVRGKTR